MKSVSNPDLLLRLQGYRLTTVEIIYYLPDHPNVLQVFIWQNLDLPPDFPRLRMFLLFWEKNIEGRLFSVKIAQSTDPVVYSLIFAKGEFKLR